MNRLRPWAGAALLFLAGCVHMIEYPGLRPDHPPRTCNYQLCEDPQSSCSGGVGNGAQACYLDADAYSFGSEGWVRYMMRSCDLAFHGAYGEWGEAHRYAGCEQLAGWVAHWERAPADFLSSIWSERRLRLHIPAEKLAEVRSLLTMVCRKKTHLDSPQQTGTACMAAALLHNLVEPRSPREVVRGMVSVACDGGTGTFMAACEYLSEKLFQHLNFERLEAKQQQRWAEQSESDRAGGEQRRAAQAREQQAREERAQSHSQMAQGAADALAQSQRSTQSAQDAEQGILAAGAERLRGATEQRTREAAERRVEAQREQERARQLQERQRERVAEVRSEDAQREEARRHANEERLAREHKAEVDRLAREQKLAEERAAKEQKLAEERAERERKQREQEEQAARSRRATEEEERRRREEQKRERDKERQEREAERKRRVGPFIADESFDMSPSGYYAKLGVRVTWSYAAGSSSMCLDSAKQTSYRVSVQLSNGGPQRVRVMIHGTRVIMNGGYPPEVSGPSGTRVLDPGGANEISADSGCAEGSPKGVTVSANFAPQDAPP